MTWHGCLMVLSQGFIQMTLLAAAGGTELARCPGRGRKDYDRTFIWCLFLSKDLLLVTSRLSQRKWHQVYLFYV